MPESPLPDRSPVRILPRRLLLSAAAAAAPLGTACAQADVPPLPDSSGWGVHVLGAASWEVIRSDTTPGALSWDFVHAFGFGPRGQIWYGTVGNGWGLSVDGGKTWKSWTYDQLGPEWQYVASGGIATRGDTTMIATADGLQVTTDDGAHWTAIVDSAGPAARGPALCAGVK